MVLPVNLWGTDTTGRAFHQLAYTLDISTGGARLAGVQVSLKAGDTVAVRYKQRKARFRVVWTGNDQVGIQYIAGERFIWVELPDEEFIDEAPVKAAPATLSGAEPPGPSSGSSQPRIEVPRHEMPVVQGAGPEMQSEPAVERSQTDELAVTLQKCLASLRSLDALVNAAVMDLPVAREFHAAAGHIRNTAWAVQQWLELQPEGSDNGSIIESVNSERVRFATQLCRELAEGQQAVLAGVSHENQQALVMAVQLLAQEFGVGNPASPLDRGRVQGTADRDPVSLLAGLNQEIRSASVPVEGTLELIAERALSFTDADGAAIALRSDNQMVCCASAGIAPLVGVSFSLTGDLAGEAMTTGRSILWRGAEDDGRVDTDLCRSVALKSSAITPIVAGDAVVGVLQVFAGRSNAFDESTLSLLERVAEFVASLEPSPRLEPAPR